MINDIFSGVWDLLILFKDGSTLLYQFSFDQDRKNSSAMTDGLIDLTTGLSIPDSVFSHEFKLLPANTAVQDKLDAFLNERGKFGWQPHL